MEPDGTIATHLGLGALGRWWNELVVDDRGGVFVDSVGFDFMAFLGGQDEPSPGLIGNGMVVCHPTGAPSWSPSSWVRG